MTCLQNKIVTTRKEHRCSGCRKKFPAKKKLRYQSGVWEGEFYSGYMCNPCYKELHRSDYYDYSDGYSEGDLGEHRRERIRDWQCDREKRRNVDARTAQSPQRH